MVASVALGVAAHVVVEVALVDYIPSRFRICRTDRVAILGAHGRREADLVLVVHVGELEEHAVDDAEVVAVLEADDLLGLAVAPLAGRVNGVEPGGALHGDVELDAGGIAATDHLAAAQHLLRDDARTRHLPDVRVVLTVGDRPALARHGREPDDRALAGLAVDLGQHDVGRRLGEGALALDRRQLAGVAQHEDRLAEGQQVARHFVADHRHLVEHDQRGLADDRLLVEDEARFVDVIEPDLEAA